MLRHRFSVPCESVWTSLLKSQNQQMSGDSDNSIAAANERKILDRFGESYFNGVRWGAGLSSAFLLDQCRRLFRYVRMRQFLVDTQHLGLDEDLVRGRTTFVRTLRRSLSTEKMFVVGMIGLVAAAGHNTLACLLSNLRVKEFERRSLGDQQAPEDAYPRTALPTFWDGFAVGCIGSVMDADLPQQPAHRYLGMRCGW
jgi:hypothetical protein